MANPNNMFYEMIGRLFSRIQMRKLGGALESAGVDYVPEAFAGLIVVLCIFGFALTYVLFTEIAPLRGFLYKMLLIAIAGITVSYPLEPTLFSFFFFFSLFLFFFLL